MIRIIIVDDHAIVRSGLANFLRAFDDLALVGETGSGIEALALCEELRPDVVMMDLVMPEMNGVEDFGLEVVKIDYSDNVIEDSTAQTIQILTEHPDIVGIFGTNVFSAQGAGAAVQEVGLGGIVEVVAFDATEFAIDLLRNGTVTQVIAQKPADIGYFAVLSAAAHARGFNSIPKRWSTGYEVINLNNVDDPAIARFIYRED